MNKNKFLDTFVLTTVILLHILLLLITSFFCVTKYTQLTDKLSTNLGGGEDIESLDEVIPDGRRNVIVFGTDKSGMRADVIMLFSFSEKESEINLMSIPRDTKVRSDKYGTQKITETLSNGNSPDFIVETVKNMLGVPIHDYVVVNFDAVEDAINAVDGVDFNVPQNMHYEDPYQDLYINLRKGYQHLNGAQALQLLRFRSYPMGDIQRTQVQRDFIKELFLQKANLKYLDNVGDVFEIVESNITSSLSYKDIVSMAAKVAKLDSPTFNTFEIPYTLADPYVLINSQEAFEIIDANFK